MERFFVVKMRNRQLRKVGDVSTSPDGIAIMPRHFMYRGKTDLSSNEDEVGAGRLAASEEQGSLPAC